MGSPFRLCLGQRVPSCLRDPGRFDFKVFFFLWLLPSNTTNSIKNRSSRDDVVVVVCNIRVWTYGVQEIVAVYFLFPGLATTEAAPSIGIHIFMA